MTKPSQRERIAHLDADTNLAISTLIGLRDYGRDVSDTEQAAITKIVELLRPSLPPEETK